MLIAVFQAISIQKEYPKRGSNPHGLLGQGILSPSCLPIPPSGQDASGAFFRGQRYSIFVTKPIFSVEKCHFYVQISPKSAKLPPINMFFGIFYKK